MKYDFVTSVLEAATEVLSEELQTEIVVGRPSLSSSPQHNSDVMTILGVVGSVEGTIMFGMSMGTALSIIGSMIGEIPDSFDDMAQSGIAEMGNVITGRASGKLATAGFACDITPPMLLASPDGKINTLSIQRLIIPLDCAPHGTIMVHVALRQSKQDSHASSTVLHTLLA